MVYCKYAFHFQIFNSRTCQLVLGAGALELVGLKTISTKNLGRYSDIISVSTLKCFTCMTLTSSHNDRIITGNIKKNKGIKL